MIKLFHITYLIFSISIAVNSQILTSSDLPLVFINTNGQEIVDEPRIRADMGIVYNGEGERNSVTDPFNNYSGKINIEIRGTTSQSFPKKQYGFETQTEDGENRNVSLLGMPEENDWILHAPFSDKTLIRNALAYHLYGLTGHYSVRTQFCELVLNGNYQGVYLIMEKIKRDKNRVNISSLSENDISGDDLTGGYIFKADRVDTTCDLWGSTYDPFYFVHSYPDCEEIAPEQEHYIRHFLNDYETALRQYSFDDPVNGYRKYIDVPSFIDFLIINELGKNIDAYVLSTFYYKDKDSENDKLHAGPVWDFNLAFGNASYRGGYKTDSLMVPELTSWSILLSDTIFRTELGNRWKILRENEFSDDNLIHIIDSLVLIVYEAQQRNFQCWDILGGEVWPNYFVGKTYYEEVGFLKNWTMERAYWLDGYFMDYHHEYKPREPFEDWLYPNPFYGILYYDFDLTAPGNISLKVYSMSGQLESVIIDNEFMLPGRIQSSWNGISDAGEKTQNGIYYLILSIDNKIVTRRKMIKAQ